jgi:toxin ParE1/3/4
VAAYTLREHAENDLEEIWLYTYEEWGLVQADSYLQSLVTRFEWLASSPYSGRKRDDIKQGYYCFPEGMHLIFYTIDENAIDIIGIPHQQRDIVNHL